ncbi:helix-turn-helix transcriptional regulator [Chryseobacterium echinoideorum]|uniref:helix-turn-helix transcriptional regulator n=1 Tax=Chryseobacterium echinoideorum TaxID=1549648 RepID=UPI001186A1B1|nr:helix-turn-helix transcriptional regulator [Chryseobacterium echinoideorum]
MLRKKIFQIRQEKGISQEQLALKSEVDRTYISDIEQGKRKVSLEVAHKLSTALEIRLSEILENYDKL